MNNQNNVWMFGTNAGLNFNNPPAPPPISITGAMNTFEGCSSICDPITGLLLFYTDGRNVYNNSHSLIASNLLGNSSSTSSAIIVPMPGSTTQYYIFAVDSQVSTGGSNNGLTYRIVDTTNQNSPTISPTNTTLEPLAFERVIAIKDAECSGYWIISTNDIGNTFYVFKLTASGLSIGTSYAIGTQTGLSIGYLKASPLGNKLALASTTGTNGILELFDFNLSTGNINNPIIVNSNITRVYGVEFSNNGTLLYYTTLSSSSNTGNGVLYQIKVDLSAPPVIISTLSNDGSGYAFGALQMGPDGIIYIAKTVSGTPNDTLAAIKQSNTVDTGLNECDFQLNEVTLSPNTSCTTGLPTLIQFEHCEKPCNCGCGCSSCNENAIEQNEQLNDRAQAKEFTIPTNTNSVSCTINPLPINTNCVNQAIQNLINLEPCFYFHWGDGFNDQIEEHDTEVFYITVCNNYNDIIFKGLRITKITLIPSVAIDKIHIVPDRFVSLDCLEPCSCQTREFAMINRANDTAGNYTLEVEYCYDEIVIASSSNNGIAEFPITITED